MNYRLFFIIITLLASAPLLLSAQELKVLNLSDNSKLELKLSNSFTLLEDDYLLGEINDYSVDNENNVLFLSNSGIIHYSNKDGSQSKFGRLGRGPFEFSDPDIVKITNNNIFIWDSNQLKISMFSLTGENHIELRGFRWAIQDFAVSGDTIFSYNSGRNTAEFIELYSISKRQFLEKKFGSQTEADKLLKAYDKSAGITIDENHFYYVTPSELKIHRVNLKNDKEETIHLNDEDFIVPEIKNANSIISQGRDKFTSILMNTSIIMDISLIKDFIILRAHIGELSYDNSFGYASPINKKVRFYVLDKSDMKLIDTFTFSFVHKEKIQFEKWDSSNNHLILFSQSSDNDNTFSISGPLSTISFFEIEKR